MATPSRRPLSPSTHGHIYSARRFKIVVTLLSLVTLPAVVGSAVLIYYYMKSAVMVDRRLHGERWMVPAKLYARPLILRKDLPLSLEGLLKVLNGLKYEETKEAPTSPGQFSVGSKSVVLWPRAVPGAPQELVVVGFDKGAIKEMRQVKGKKTFASVPLEPELITYLFDETREKRRIVKYDELPEHLIKAVLAIEDRRFFSHPGLDPFRIVGAALRNLKADTYLQGGSTVTQQLVKNFFLTPERTVKRKLHEALLAFVLERRANKKEILELYLNEIYLGQVGSFSIQGIGEAARMYFHKDVGNLTVSESALLAGMIQSPNPYNPYRHAKKAQERRNLVLKAMVEAQFLEAPTAEKLIAEPVQVDRPQVDSVEAPYFVDLVKEQLTKRYDQKDLNTQSLAIYTTIDLHLQSLAQDVLSRGLDNVEKMVRKKAGRPPVQGALIAIEPRTGAVLAMAGGRSYGSSQYNRVTLAKRQPGSTFKPFVYLTAIEATFDAPELPPLTPATVVEDEPSVFFFEDKEYTPQNYEGKYFGRVTLRKALAHSLNVATVKVAEMVGFDRVADLWNKKLAMNAKVQPYPAIALGSFEATPLEMATAYNILANGGLKMEPVTVKAVSDEKGRTLEQHAQEPQRVVRPESAFIVTHMLRSVLNTGTAAGARGMGFQADAAGKTGTTNDMRDAWFAGYTPDLLCVVWVGFDDNSPLNLSGARAALPVWVEFMKGALAGTKPAAFPVPPDAVIFLDIDPETGRLATASCPKTFSEAFIAGTEPQEYCHAHDGGEALADPPHGLRP